MSDPHVNRVVIANVEPAVDSGRFPVKRVVGETVHVEADVFAEGHDELKCVLLSKACHDREWRESEMRPLGNDRWRGSFEITQLVEYVYTLSAWVDHFMTWTRDLRKRIAAGQDVSVDLRIGAELVRAASRRARGADRESLNSWALQLDRDSSVEERVAIALSKELADLMSRHANRQGATRYDHELVVQVDRQKARFSTWYEMFPRSCASVSGRHGTLADCTALLPYVQSMGFDVLYLPPIHPIGLRFRKGKNNSATAEPDDVGSPWAIGSSEGGHKAIHPQLGTLEDFRRLVANAQELGIEVAMDLAYQCSADHPYLREHPEWFLQRPDGTIQYAENPPKKYQDIYPIYFETHDRDGLWNELLSIPLYWAEQGIRIFRVDNPHTKPFAFWEWLIREVKQRYPDTLFLAEAFTRPKVMYRLAKMGFTQSYTYFAWRNTKWEIEQYFKELTQTPVREYFRPNLWPNTPDILTEYLQVGGRPAFMARLVLTATLGASYGIYGPAFELLANEPREPASEEYQDSEKYQIRDWNRDDPASLKEFIARVNRIRRENAALQSNDSLQFHRIDNESIICYSKQTPDGQNTIVVCVNLDPHHTQTGWMALPAAELGLPEHESYQVHDLLTGARYIWHGDRHYVELNPLVCPAHLFVVRRRVRREQDFDYFL